MVTKECKHCLRVLPLDDFYRQTGRARSWCKACMNDYSARLRQTPRGRRRVNAWKREAYRRKTTGK
jgi:hypothetical protein